MRFTLSTAITATLAVLSSAQQYAGDVIPNSLPGLSDGEIAYFRIKDPAGKNNNLTLINYINHNRQGNRLVDSELQRAIIVIHGLNRDPGTYEVNMLSAMSQLDPSLGINKDNVAIMAPMFASGNDKQGNTDQYAYPWVDGKKAGLGSVSNCLVWKGSQWSAGGDAQYPKASENTISSYYVLDELVQYFDNASQFPNMKQIVVSGHSLGAQMVQRYAALGKQLNTRVPVTHYIGNPNSYVWLSQDRPLSTGGCDIYDDYREGYSNFKSYPMTYGLDLVASGREAIQANYHSKQIAYGRATQDLGDASSSCAAGTTGSNRNERFFNFINAFPPSCDDPNGRNCDTVDYVNTGHDGGAMFASKAGQARLFIDNWNGNGSRAYDFGTRQQSGDNPYPNPDILDDPTSKDDTVYAGNQTYSGCWSDQSTRSLPYMIYDNSDNNVQKCTSACADAGYSISGLQYGSQCFCGNKLTSQATQVIQSSCQMSCPGNSTQTCGGNNRLSLYSNGKPEILPAPSNREQVDDFYYQRCVTEGTSSRALTGMSTSGNSMTLEVCAKFCVGSKYFATSYGSECYCGNSIASGASEVSNSQCSKTCAADQSQFCGAGNRYSLYMNPDVVVSASAAPSATSTRTTQGSSKAGDSTAATTGTTTTRSSTTESSPTSTALTCPNSDKSIYTAPNGQKFRIECDTDHQGGDMASVGVSSLKQCIDECASRSGCVDVSLSGNACYMKSVLGPALNAPGIWGAKLETSTPSSTSGSSSSTTLLTSTSSSSSAAATTSTTSSIQTSSSSSATASSTSSTVAISSSSVAATSVSSVTTLSTQSSSSSSTSESLSSSTAVTIIPSSSSSSEAATTPASSTASSSSTSSVASSSSTTSGMTSSALTTTTSTASSLSTSSSSSTTSTTTAPTLPTGYSSVGCYKEAAGSRALPFGAGSTSSQTPSECAKTCQERGYKYSGTEYGQECWCGKNAPSTEKVTASDCSMRCPGDNTQKCGAGNRLSVVVNDAFTNSFVAREKYDTWNMMACYMDNGGPRALGSFVSLEAFGGSANATTANCMDACRARGLTYCGTEYYSECWGSNSAPTKSIADGPNPLDAGCSFPCNGNKTEACGGSGKILVYINNGTSS